MNLPETRLLTKSTSKGNKFVPPQRAIVLDPFSRKVISYKRRKLYTGSDLNEKFGENSIEISDVVNDYPKETSTRTDTQNAKTKQKVSCKSNKTLKPVLKLTTNKADFKTTLDKNSNPEAKSSSTTTTTPVRRKRQTEGGDVMWTIRQHLENDANCSESRIRHKQRASNLEMKKTQLEVLATIYKMQNQLQILRERRAHLAEKMKSKSTAQEE